MFFKNLACFVLLKHLCFEIRPFALLPTNFHIFPLMSSFLTPKVSIKLEKINPKRIICFMFNNYISTCGKLPKIFVMKISLQNKKNSEYTVSTRVSAQGAHLILGSQKKGERGGTYSRQALFRRRRLLNISRRHQNIFDLYIFDL